MQRIFLFSLCFFAYQYCFAQSTETVYPKTLTFKGDQVQVRFSNFPRLIPLTIGEQDTLDMGTDAGPGQTATLYFGSDSLRFTHTNAPYAQVFYIPFQTPERKFVFRLHFNTLSAYFPESYIAQNKGAVQVEVPEVYELANIIWTLSPSGQRSSTLNKEGAYYEEVMSYFKPYLKHAVFQKLDFPDSLYFQKYYDFRENSFAYQFQKNKIRCTGPYYYVRGDDWDNHSSLFQSLIPLIEDFAKKSKFRTFYKNHQAYYAEQIKREKELMPVKSMWDWLETAFSPIKYQAYKVVFSPLIGGSHSTQRFGTFSNSAWFTEIVFFVCGTESYDKNTAWTEKQKEGLMSGIVFTEIDHNYVNPISYRYEESIDSIFSNRAFWTSQGGDNALYETHLAVFNEYMTHAVFCLWVAEHYDKATADFVISKRESMMVDRRHFSQFKAFNQKLLELRQEHRETLVKDLYPAVLKWCKMQG